MAIKIGLKLNRQSIQLANRSPELYVQAIDSVNRVIPDQAEDFTVTIILSEQQKRAIEESQSIHIEIDGDKSIQTLYVDKKDNGAEQVVALFKPYLQLANKPDVWFYWAKCVGLTASKLDIAVPWQAEPRVKKAVNIRTFSVDYKQKPFSEIANLKESLINKKIKLYEGGTATSVEFFTKQPEVTFVSAQVIQSANGVILKGKHFGDAEFFGVAGDPQNNPKTTIYSPEGDPLDVPLESLISGQLIKGVIDAGASEFYLLQGNMLAMIENTSPLMVQPLTYNGVVINTLAALALDIQNSEDLSVGDVLSVTGFGTQETFFGQTLKRIDEERLTYSIILPQSLSESLVTEIQEDRLLVLNEKTQNHSKESLRVENTTLSLALDVDFIEATDASVSIYTDRLIDSQRFESFSDFSQALPVILFQLESMHHINEIHATGFLKGSIFIANKIDLVFYGFSTFDFMSTHRQLDQLAAEDLEANDLIDENDNQKAYLIGGGLAVGLVLSVSGVLLARHLFNKNKQTQPYLVSPSVSPLSDFDPNKPSDPDSVDPNDEINNRETDFNEVEINFGKEKYTAKILSVKKPEVTYAPGEEIYQMPKDINSQGFDKVIVSKINNELFIDSYKDGKIVTRVQAQETPEDLKDFINTPYIAKDEEAIDPNKGVDLRAFYLDNYPAQFQKVRSPQGYEYTNFNGDDVKFLLDKSEYVSTETAINFLDAVSKTQKELFVARNKDNNEVAAQIEKTKVADLKSAKSPKERIAIEKKAQEDLARVDHQNNQIVLKQYGGTNMPQAESQRLRDRVAEYTARFIQSDKKYAILPVLPGQHFGALLLIKDNEAQDVKPFYIEPREISKLELDSAAYFLPQLLPSDDELNKHLTNKLKTPLDLKNKTQFLSTGIQIDTVSCGPIALVTAMDLVDKVEARQLSFNEITGRKMIGFVNELRKTPQYTQEKGQANFRERMLLMLDTAKVFDQTAYDYNRRVRKKP